MKATSQTLIEQLKMTEHEIDRRKKYIGFTDADIEMLKELRETVEDNIETIIDRFYENILSFTEMDRIIGDAETLRRLKNFQKNYVLSLFDGQYDEDYVHSRLRIGLVHKRIGVAPKFYISAFHNLNSILRNIITESDSKNCVTCSKKIEIIEKILMFDLSLAFDTYINSLMDEARRAKETLESYAESLEEVVSERTELLRKQARYDGLTCLLNQRSFYEELKRELSRGTRRGHSTALIYFDLDGFKQLNDNFGHKRGDEILKAVAQAVQSTVRESDLAARYGGDEFCVILPESNEDEAEQFCRRLCRLIEEAVGNDGISCSVGIAISDPAVPYDVNSFVKQADKAMYQAKKEPGFSIRKAGQTTPQNPTGNS